MHSLIFASNSVIGRFGLILPCFSVSGHVRTVVLEINVRRQETVLPRQHENALFFLASLFLIWNQLKCNWITWIREHRYRDTAPIKASRWRTRRCGLSQDIDPPYPLFPHQSGPKSLTNMFNQREQTVPCLERMTEVSAFVYKCLRNGLGITGCLCIVSFIISRWLLSSWKWVLYWLPPGVILHMLCRHGPVAVSLTYRGVDRRARAHPRWRPWEKTARLPWFASFPVGVRERMRV